METILCEDKVDYTVQKRWTILCEDKVDYTVRG